MAPLTVLTFVLASFACSRVAADKGLRLKSYSEDEVKGCYEHNKTLGVCFDVKKGSMKIEKTSGEEIVYYQELGPDMLLYQVLDKAFIGYGPSMFYVPDEVPRKPEALRAFVKNILEDEDEQHEALKNHYEAAMSELRNVPEVQLLERLSAALGDNSTRLEILQPFHGFCLNLLKNTDIEIPDELRAAPDMEDEPTDQHNREKRCSRPRANTCRGMCGPGCTCWSWYCGDCCTHQGCYEHDLCCKKNRFSSYCFTFPKCSRFSGYPKCLRSSSGWR